MNGPMMAESAPAMIRERMSRPSGSVPSQCSGDGGALVSSRSCWNGSYGSIHDPKSARKMTRPTTTRDMVMKIGGTLRRLILRTNHFVLGGGGDHQPLALSNSTRGSMKT